MAFAGSAQARHEIVNPGTDWLGLDPGAEACGKSWGPRKARKPFTGKRLT